MNWVWALVGTGAVGLGIGILIFLRRYRRLIKRSQALEIVLDAVDEMSKAHQKVLEENQRKEKYIAELETEVASHLGADGLANALNRLHQD